MDWTKVLRSLQSDFLKRLSSGHLLHTQKQGEHSELTIISGERLRQLRDFCWEMAEKYKRAGTVRDVFISNLKGKLGEEVVKERLADFITEVDYEKKLGGDGGIDFTLNSDTDVGIEVKSRCGFFNKVKWSLTVEEVRKNSVVACVLIQEEVNEAQSEYHLIFAGFLPTEMIKLKTGKIYFGIEQLLYGGGLRFFLEEAQAGKIQDKSIIFYRNSEKQENSWQSLKKTNQHDIDNYPFSEQELRQNNHANSHLNQINRINNQRQNDSVLRKESEYFYIELANKQLNLGNFATAIEYYSKIIDNHKHNYKKDELYYKRAFARYQLEDYQGTVDDCSFLISTNPNHIQAYNLIAQAYYQLTQYQQAIFNYTQVIRLNPLNGDAYRNRADARYDLGDKQGAIEDYAQAIKINPFDSDTYTNLTTNLLEDSKSRENHQFISRITPETITDCNAYKQRGKYRYDVGDYIGAIKDYTQAININSGNINSSRGNSQNQPQDIEIYHLRGDAYYDAGNKEKAIEDYTQAISINSQHAIAYYQRGCAFYDLADKASAIEDFQIAAELYKKQGNISKYKEVREKILELEIEASLDILDF
ncbi:MAG: tetratricopeptide repeat protein [Mastigocoleus sp.]